MVQFGGSDAQWNRDMKGGWCRNEFKQGFHSDVVLRLREYTTVTCLKKSYTGSTYLYILYDISCFVNRLARKAWILQTVGKKDVAFVLSIVKTRKQRSDSTDLGEPEVGKRGTIF